MILSAEMLFFYLAIILAFSMILLQITLLNLPFRDKSESEALEIKEAIDAWFKKHPVYSLILCFMPPLAWALFIGVVKPGVKNDREIDYSSIES